MEVLVGELCGILSQSELDVRVERMSPLTIPASTQTALSWAPFMSSVERASSSKLQSADGLCNDLLDSGVVELTCVNLQNHLTRRFVRQGELDFTVQTSGSQQRWVEDINSVGSSDDLGDER